MNKAFVSIPGYESYFINKKGEIISTKRNKNKKLKPSINSRGYLVVGLCKNGIEKKYKIHQLVALSYLGHNINGMNCVVDHIDNNKLNNNVSNLQIISQRKNAMKNSRKGTSKYVGVSWSKRDKKWCSRIWNKNKYESLGYFDNEYQAHLSYQKRLKEINNE